MRATQGLWLPKVWKHLSQVWDTRNNPIQAQHINRRRDRPHRSCGQRIVIQFIFQVQTFVWATANVNIFPVLPGVLPFLTRRCTPCIPYGRKYRTATRWPRKWSWGSCDIPVKQERCKQMISCPAYCLCGRQPLEPQFA